MKKISAIQQKYITRLFSTFLIGKLLLWLSALLWLLNNGEIWVFLQLHTTRLLFSYHPALWLTEISAAHSLMSIFVILLIGRYPTERLTLLFSVITAWYICITINYKHFRHWIIPEIAIGHASTLLLGSGLQPKLNFPSTHAAVISTVCSLSILLILPSKLSIMLLTTQGLFARG